MEILPKDLTTMSTIHTVSYAKYYIKINSMNDFHKIQIFCEEKKLKLQILGNGTNILFTKDRYEDVLFVKLGKKFSFLKVYKTYVEVGGSFSLVRAGKKLINLGYRDFIYMTLIPGSLGGGVRQNAGTTNEGEIKDTFISAELYDIEQRRIIQVDSATMNFSYRNSMIQTNSNRYIVLSAKFSLKNKSKSISALKEEVLMKQKNKRDKEPSGFCFGSTFKSSGYPEKVWWYIDKADLKGKVIGGAKFSEKHANWIVNYNNASASDILNLINEAKNKVLERFDINLKVEVDLI